MIESTFALYFRGCLFLRGGLIYAMTPRAPMVAGVLLRCRGNSGNPRKPP